jgi:two-component system, NtrC family, response regulator GlrR
MSSETRRTPPNLESDVYTESLTSDPHEHALVRSFRLLVLSGPDADAVYRSTGDRAVIGTHASADLVLQDRTASRFHCEIAVFDGRAAVRDLGSLNGTRINHVPVVQAYLRSGTLLSLGRTQIRFDFGHAKVKIPLSSDQRFGLMVGRSSAMRAVFAILQRAAQSDATVLLEGETGTGKEIAAESIHRESTRRDGPFLVVDCGAISPDLIESELFGHERGAFTDARQQKRGLLELAEGGTVYLDEIGEMVSALQAKLLRFLEEKAFKRVGGSADIRVDVRVIAATNRNLDEEVRAGRFRSDLFYRLNVLPITLPALRMHLDDLPVLMNFYIDTFNREFKKNVRGVSAAAMRALSAYGWPGNIRELRNAVERAMLLADGTVLDTKDFPIASATREPITSGFELPADGVDLDQIERSLVLQALTRSDWNQTRAATLLGLNRDQIRYRIEKFSLTPAK